MKPLGSQLTLPLYSKEDWEKYDASLVKSGELLISFSRYVKNSNKLQQKISENTDNGGVIHSQAYDTLSGEEEGVSGINSFDKLEIGFRTLINTIPEKMKKNTTLFGDLQSSIIGKITAANFLKSNEKTTLIKVVNPIYFSQREIQNLVKQFTAHSN